MTTRTCTSAVGSVGHPNFVEVRSPLGARVAQLARAYQTLVHFTSDSRIFSKVVLPEDLYKDHLRQGDVSRALRPQHRSSSTHTISMQGAACFGREMAELKTWLYGL